MKLVKAYIRPNLLEDICHALRKEGYGAMTVTECEGTGQYCDPDHQHGSLSFPAMHSHVAKIEIAVESEEVDEVRAIIIEQARTGHKGDGMVFVSPLESVTRIRDGKRGEEALRS